MLLLFSSPSAETNFSASLALKEHIFCMNKLQMWLERNRRQIKFHLSPRKCRTACSAYYDAILGERQKSILKKRQKKPFDWLGLNLLTM